MKIKNKMLLLCGCLITLVALHPLIAQESSSGPYDQKIDVVYGEVHGTGLLMDVFTPKGPANGLAIIDVVSGAWHSDRGKIREHTMAQVYSIYSSRGYTVFGVRPGSRTRYTALEMADHVKTAIRYVKQHASEYKIDPDRIGLTGASAGGHLATLVALTPEDASPDSRNPLLRHDTRLKAAAVFFPPTDFLDWDGKPASTALLGDLMFLGGVKGHSEEEIKERAAQISPARQVKATPIPFLLIHGDADPLVPLQQSQKMLEVLKMAGGSAELIVKKGGGHPWMTIPEEVKIMADWFDRQLTAAQAATLVIDEIEMAKTPQAATWFFCFEADIDGVKARHYRENKGYDKNQLTIPLSLELAKVKPGQKCSFRVQLDDVDDDACGDEPDNRSTGEFTVSERGSQSYKPEDEWRYTLRWHLK